MNDNTVPVANLVEVSFRYGKHFVLTDASWSVFPGITALMGPNGAGKTTLLSLLAGVLRPTSGEIKFSSSKTLGESSSPKVGLLPQRYDLVGGMSVRETVSHAAWSSGVLSNQVDVHVRRALERVDLWTKARHRVKSLSGGQRQRLAIACTLSAEPDLLLLDEPSVGLDPVQRRGLRDLLNELSEDTPIVLSTHLVDDAVATASHVAILDGGSFVYSGELATFTGGRDLESAYVDAVAGRDT